MRTLITRVAVFLARLYLRALSKITPAGWELVPWEEVEAIVVPMTTLSVNVYRASEPRSSGQKKFRIGVEELTKPLIDTNHACRRLERRFHRFVAPVAAREERTNDVGTRAERANREA